MTFQLRSMVLLTLISGAAAMAGCGDDEASPDGIAGDGGADGSKGGTPAGAGKGGATAGAAGSSAGKAGSAAGGMGGEGGSATGAAGEGGMDAIAGTGGMGEGGSSSQPCVTSFPGELLHSFDAPGSIAGWAVKTVLGDPADLSLGDASLARDTSIGHTCAGSLRLDVPFSSYAATTASSVSAEINYSPARQFVSQTPDGGGGADAGGASGNAGAAGGSGTPAKLPVLHAWVKVETPANNAQFLAGAQPYVNTAAYTKYANKYYNVEPSWNDGSWHELVLDFATVCAEGYCSDGTPDSATVLQLGIELIVRKAAPDGGPAMPPASRIYIDDIWVE